MQISHPESVNKQGLPSFYLEGRQSNEAPCMEQIAESMHGSRKARGGLRAGQDFRRVFKSNFCELDK